MARIVSIVVLVGALVAGVVAFSSSDDVASTAVIAEDLQQTEVTELLTTTTSPMLDQAPPMLGEVRDLVNIEAWLQADDATVAGLDSQVRIVQFWTFGCRNCKATIPTLQHIYSTYKDQGFEIVGVHSPEFSYEKEVDAVTQAAKDLGVTWPIALDQNKRNFFSWQGSPAYWPRTYVIDRDGNIRFDHIGEGAYEELEATVAYLLAEGS